ncbi:MAG TPA: ATP-binding cassette domain-containing protein [Abditibacteriaceae bacterium]|jgi:ABC-2 type transport system ATP-binding protein
MAAISVSHLSRRFSTHVKQPGFLGAVRGLVRRETKVKTAVDDVSFQIDKGEFVGFLGPNGAGKTTTLKILSGVLHPTSGEATVLGYVPWKREAALQRRFSLVLGQKNQLWWDLPAIDSFLLNRDIYEIDNGIFTRKVDELADLLDLKDLLRVPVRKLSLGERMKCEVAASLLHSPEVLFLDEPTIGLDVVSQVRIREFLRQYNQQSGITVILTSHYMADIEALCKRVIVINEGKAIFDGALRDLAGNAATRRAIRLTLPREATPEEWSRVQQLSPEATNEGVRLTVAVPRDEVASSVGELLSFLPVADLTVDDVDIESVIRDLFIQNKTVTA